MDIINKLPIDIMLNIYSYTGPKLLYVNNKELLKNIISIKNGFKEKGIRIYYQIREVITQSTDKHYNPKYNVYAECNVVYRGYMDIGGVTNINTIRSSEYFDILLPKTKYELLRSSVYSYPNFKVAYKKTHYEYSYIKVDNICEFKNYQLVWKKYT
jgi:hypothetical protein